MKRNIAFMAALTLTLASPAIPGFAIEDQSSTEVSTTSSAPQKFKGEEFAKDAKISLHRARAIALKALPGKITDQELEEEKGGSGLRYSFDIKKGSTVYEVGVDAKTGKVLEKSKEGLHPD